MKIMAGYTKVATYTKYQKRWYHEGDRTHTGPSVSLQAFHRGERPAPLRPQVECYEAKDTLRLVVERQQGKPVPPAPVLRPRLTEAYRAMACASCGRVSLCTCGTPPPPGLDAIVTLKRQRGTMP